ncbi:GNAT family N-acetyltransferase [Antrihabitans sp. NCIMB 15449]|uniref:GNAT family N-acetyltransferase n=1 Tax=Antrihabitans spumae TaxID=3373370 RepID=A0ABW7KUD7_9NOCA
MAAAASDPEAQRWLGWPQGIVVNEPERSRELRITPGTGSARTLATPGHEGLVVIDAAARRVAGLVTVSPKDTGTADIGVVLAPDYRRRGYGSELFGAAAIFAHRHLGIAVVDAGTETTHTASIRALSAAGFVAPEGPTPDTLPNGRTIDALWFRHSVDESTMCEGPQPID